ncbi:hypothetical protein A2635_04630 [Candidatus Peribacteria bacterium RIFCSPHIGHO2_01_FULL_51_9]|nr:MAG: hypothetical protein A2635_04630 [Candidatus Peribacteria bacterium RIFCSPHIGHO2_01_FULL_51_9]
MSLPIEVIVLRMGLSLLFGGLIGLEREYRGKPAGIRTIAFVSVGSTLMMLIAITLHAENGGGSSDVIRMLQGIVTGIGFLGAGSVIQMDNKVKGLTTAAAIWMIGAIGAAVGAGYYALAIVAEVFSLILIAVKPNHG